MIVCDVIPNPPFTVFLREVEKIHTTNEKNKITIPVKIIKYVKLLIITLNARGYSSKNKDLFDEYMSIQVFMASIAFGTVSSGFTLYHVPATFPFSSTRTEERMIPSYFFPYMDFSPHAPYASATA